MDGKTMRTVFGHFGSGLTVVTGLSAEGPVGFTCQSFFSLSLDPPLITIAPARTSTTWPRIRRLPAFGVNILAEHQTAESTAFSRSGADKFTDVDWSESAHGTPVLAGSLVHLDCRLWAEYDGGDHTLIAAEVLDFTVEAVNGPLLFFKGAYHTAQPQTPPPTATARPRIAS